MATKRHGAMTDWEFIRAAQVEVRECELNHDVAIKIELGLDTRRPVVGIVVSAYEVAGGGAQERLCRYSTEWPNSYVQTFTACLFQACIQLERLVQDSRRDEALIGAQRG